MVIQNVNELMEYSLLKKCIIFVIYFGVEYFFLTIPVAMVTLIRNIKPIYFCICLTDVDYLKYVKIIHILLCWKEIICFEYKPFCEIADGMIVWLPL